MQVKLCRQHRVSGNVSEIGRSSLFCLKALILRLLSSNRTFFSGINELQIFSEQNNWKNEERIFNGKNFFDDFFFMNLREVFEKQNMNDEEQTEYAEIIYKVSPLCTSWVSLDSDWTSPSDGYVEGFNF